MKLEENQFQASSPRAKAWVFLLPFLICGAFFLFNTLLLSSHVSDHWTFCHDIYSQKCVEKITLRMFLNPLSHFFSLASHHSQISSSAALEAIAVAPEIGFAPSSIQCESLRELKPRLHSNTNRNLHFEKNSHGTESSCTSFTFNYHGA
jgi:hypothetical protein